MNALPCVFVLSCERSGSTLLRSILDTHAEICSPGELVLGELVRVLRRVAERTVAKLVPEEKRDEVTRAEVRRVIGELMERYAAGRGKRIWCDKSPLNLAAIGHLEWAFPEARYICLYRRSLDVVRSALDVSRYGFMEGLAQYVARSPHDVVAALLESWADKTEQLLALETRAPNAFRLYYEALVNDPSAVLDALFRFLGVSADAGLPARVFSTPHDSGGGDPKFSATTRIETDRVGRGNELAPLLERVPAALLARIANLHLTLNYPL